MTGALRAANGFGVLQSAQAQGNFAQAFRLGVDLLPVRHSATGVRLKSIGVLATGVFELFSAAADSHILNTR